MYQRTLERRLRKKNRRAYIGLVKDMNIGAHSPAQRSPESSSDRKH